MNEKNKEIELLKREITKLKHENEKHENREKNGNYNKEEIENIISQVLTKFKKKFNEKFDELKLETLKRFGIILQETSNIEVIQNNNNITKKLFADINSSENLNNENNINEIKNNENNINEINDFEFITIKNNNNITNNNSPTGNKVNENKKTDVKKKTLTEKEKKEKEKRIKNQEKQTDIYNYFLHELFFNEDGSVNSKTLELNSKPIHKKMSKIFKDLKNCDIDPFKYFTQYKKWFMLPMINDPKVNSEEKETLKTKITFFSNEIIKYTNL